MHLNVFKLQQQANANYPYHSTIYSIIPFEQIKDSLERIQNEKNREKCVCDGVKLIAAKSQKIQSIFCINELATNLHQKATNLLSSKK